MVIVNKIRIKKYVYILMCDNKYFSITSNSTFLISKVEAHHFCGFFIVLSIFLSRSLYLIVTERVNDGEGGKNI